MSAVRIHPSKEVMSLTKKQRERIALLKASNFFRFAPEDRCYACGGTNFSIYTVEDRYRFPLSYVSCQNCGYLFANPYYTEECLAEFYQKHYNLIYGRAVPSKQIRNEYINAIDIILPFIKKHIPLEGAVLDYGCGYGGTLLAFSDKWDRVGFDYDPELNERGAKLGLDLRNINEFENHKNKYDVIVLNQVLEHVTNPIELLNRLQSKLQVNGVIYIGVPGIGAILKKCTDPRIAFKNAHRHFFCLDSLVRVAACAGFHLINGDENVRAVFRLAMNADPKVTEDIVLSSVWLKRLAGFSPQRQTPLAVFVKKYLELGKSLFNILRFNQVLTKFATRTSRQTPDPR